MPEIEEWRPVVDWPNYAVSNLGRIKRVATGYIRKPIVANTGYLVITLTTRSGRRQLKTIHSLVAEAFLGPRPGPEMQVNHLDANRGNPRLENLEWATASRNREHGYEVGFADATGEANGHSKLTEPDVLHIRANGGPGRWNRYFLQRRHRSDGRAFGADHGPARGGAVMQICGLQVILASDPVPPLLRFGRRCVVVSGREYSELLSDAIALRSEKALTLLQEHEQYLSESRIAPASL